MATVEHRWRIGNRIAPPRFVLFCLLFGIGLIAGIPLLGPGRGTLGAFDVASALFLVSIVPLLRHADADEMRAASTDNDANRAGLLALTGLVMIVILVALASELHAKTNRVTIGLVIGTLMLAWLFSNMIYALHYAHQFYLGDQHGKDSGGLDIPECKEPDYWDFIYVSFTLGMTFQTSDVAITTRAMRRVAIGQCVAAFVFNIGVLAFTINLLGS